MTKGLVGITDSLVKITKGVLGGINIPLEDDAKAISLALQNVCFSNSIPLSIEPIETSNIFQFVNAQAKVLQIVLSKAGLLNPIVLLEPALVTALNSVNSAVGVRDSLSV